MRLLTICEKKICYILVSWTSYHPLSRRSTNLIVSFCARARGLRVQFLYLSFAVRRASLIYVWYSERVGFSKCRLLHRDSEKEMEDKIVIIIMLLRPEDSTISSFYRRL